MQFSTIDYVLFVLYALLIVGIGLYVSRTKKGHQRNAEDYFLASKSLPWWAIGASLIAANISAEQLIGMSGLGFSAIGLAIASYEWMAAITLLIVGKYFLPIFIKKNLFTIPDFIKQRYSVELKTILAIFWIALFTFVNLATVLYLGATALDTIFGDGNGGMIIYAVIGLALFAAAYSLWGGLSAVAWTDVVQVIMLVIGGVITTWMALSNVTDGGVIDGMIHVVNVAPERFHMILEKGHPMFDELPGIAVLVGGLWVANLYYWGFNQYIIQRALAAKNLREAQKGIAFAAFLKMLIPLIVVIPGIIAFVIYSQPAGTSIIDSASQLAVATEGGANDNAYPWLIKTFVPTGLKGLVLAALAAAIVSSLASMMNSISTIFTMDIYQQYFNKNSTDKQTITVGRLAAAVALVIAVILAPLLGSARGVFNIIQEYTGLVSPGILAIFLLGLFWKKATNRGAIWGALLSIPIAFYLKVGSKDWMEGSSFQAIFPDLPWMHQMGLTCLLTMAVIAIFSWLEGKGKDDDKAIIISKSLFKTGPVFNISAFIIMILLAGLYSIFW
jgi:SSS family solute:Na+ symporter